MNICRDDPCISYTPPHTAAANASASADASASLTNPADYRTLAAQLQGQFPVMSQPMTAAFDASKPMNTTAAAPTFPVQSVANGLPAAAKLGTAPVTSSSDPQLQAALQQLMWYHHYINWLGMMNQLQQQAALAYQQQQQLRQLQQQQAQLRMTASQPSSQAKPGIPSTNHAAPGQLRSASIVPQGSSPHPAKLSTSVRPATTMQNAHPFPNGPTLPPLPPGNMFGSSPMGWPPINNTSPINPYILTNPQLATMAQRPPSGFPQRASPLYTSPIFTPSPLPSPFLQTGTPTQQFMPHGDVRPSAHHSRGKRTAEFMPEASTTVAKRPKSGTSLETIQGCGVEGQSWISLAQLCEMDDWSIGKCTRHIPCHRPKGSLGWVYNWVKGLRVPEQGDSDAYDNQRLEADMPSSDAFTPTHAASSCSFPQQSVSSGRRAPPAATKMATTQGATSTTQLAKRERHRELLRDTNNLEENIERLNSKRGKLHRKLERLHAKVLTRYADGHFTSDDGKLVEALNTKSLPTTATVH